MAFLTIKSACFLLMITLALSSNGVMVESAFGNSRTPSWLQKISSAINKKNDPAVARAINTRIRVNNGLLDIAEQELKTVGERMAQKLFGTVGRKGFTWGWNGSKYYLKAANKCSSYKQKINPYCIRQPHKLRSLQPNCFAECVIEFSTKDGKLNGCAWHNDDSCNYNVIGGKCFNGAPSKYNCTIING